MDSFAYMVTDANPKVSLVKRFDFKGNVKDSIELGRKLQPLIVEENLIKKDFQSVRIGVNTRHFTLVPKPLFQGNKQTDYLSHTGQIGDDDKIQMDEIKFLGANLVYTLDKGIQYLLKLCFPQSTVFHFFTPFLNAIQQIKIQESIQGNFLFVDVKSKDLQVAVFIKDELKLINSYSYHSAEDFLYFISLLFDQFQLEPQQTQIFFSGLIHSKDPKFSLIYSKIEDITLAKWPNSLPVGNRFKTSGQQHQFFSLAGLLYC